MKEEAMEMLMDKWMNEPDFRHELRRDAQAAVVEAGVDLTDDDMKALKSVDWSLSDEELQSRLSKAG